MTALRLFPAGDRLLVATFALLAVTSLAVAAEAHLLCDFFCIHGDQMAMSEICATRS
jgi:hypothetical protein